jgi:hypothetical protein
MMTKDKVKKLHWSLRALGVGTICMNLACGDITPAALVGESAHFRLHQDLSVDLEAGVSAADILAGLEVNWSGTQVLLAMPDGKVDYYVMAENHIHAACESDSSAACTDRTTIYSTSYVNQHELNHAYSYIRFGYLPLPLLREGLAEAIGCYMLSDVIFVDQSVPWRQVVVEGPTSDVYAQGLQLARYLISIGGIEKFLRYYGQSPTSQDADVFAANFAAFWGTGLDEVWSAMHVVVDRTNRLPWVNPLCPCSLPALPTDGQPSAADILRHPYFTLPDLGSDSLALKAASSTITLTDCEQVTTLIGGFDNMLIRVGGGYYVTVTGGSATTGAYVSDTCDTAAVYEVPTNRPLLGIAARGFGADPNTVFVQLRVSSPGHVQSSEQLTVCSSCADFDGPSCLPQPSNTLIPVQDTFYVRMNLWPSGVTPKRVDLSFLP